MSLKETAAQLQEELSCPICLACFSDPVSIHCGHNFCQECITKYWNTQKKKSFCCPQCRKGSLKKILIPSRALKNIAEITPKLNVKTTAEEEQVCKMHQEPMKLFCKDDLVLLCVVCDKSTAHQGHKVLPIEEAAQQYKEEIHMRVNDMKQKKTMLHEFMKMQTAISQNFQEKINSEMQITEASFEKILHFLQDQKQLLLIQWHSLQTIAAHRQNEAATKFSEMVSQLSCHIAAEESRCQLPMFVFLQELKKTNFCRLNKRKFEEEMEKPSDLEEWMNSLLRKSALTAQTLKKIEGTLTSELEKLQKESPADTDTKTDSKSDLADAPKRRCKAKYSSQCPLS